ncbi:MAG: hypothetical protein KAS13_01455 [Candidatus Omnitrophica bacterium]|nr:hypothetical protein [Candidatus Omnitrophota bacterium]
MDEVSLAKAEAIRKAYAQAKEMKEEGVPGDMIEDAIKIKLIESGIEPAAAVLICSNLPGVRPELKDNMDAGRKSMIMGAVLVVLGLIIAWISELFIVKKGVLYYVIALGPIFAGMGIFVKGVFDYKSRL